MPQREFSIKICLTLRQTYADVFSFILFHENSHLLALKNRVIIDYENNFDEENKSDKFFSNILIDEKKYANYKKSDINSESIVKFARENGVLSCIDVGKLQYDKIIPFFHFNDLKIKYDWKKT